MRVGLGKNTGGTLAISTGGDPDVLIPSLVQSVQGAQITDMIYDRLADIGDSLNILNDKGFTPRLADHWTWSADSLSIAFHINPKAKWHDGLPVRSNDVQFTVAKRIRRSLRLTVVRSLSSMNRSTSW